MSRLPSAHGSVHGGAIATAVLCIASLALSACGSVPTPTIVAPSAAVQPRPIVIDADMDHSDLAAIAVLLRDPTVDVRAITISGTGLVHCAGGRRVTRYLLEQMGVPDIPFACGRENGGPDARPFPDEWRAVADDAYGLEIPPQPQSGLPPDATTVLLEAVATSPSAPTIVALGPWTNLEDAFAADPTVADRIAGIHTMLGVVDAPGNVFVDGRSGADPLEWNAFADPSSVSAVFATDVPIDLIPLDATDDVPVPADLADRLAEDHTGAGADLMYELLVRNPSRLRADEGQQLWDELAALALGAPDLVTWEPATLMVGDGGRLTRDDAGHAVRVAVAADRPAVEQALLAALRRGAARVTPFQLAGEIDATFDGTTCRTTTSGADARAGFVAGLYRLRYTGPAGVPSGVTVIGVQAPKRWADLVSWLATIDISKGQEPPAWIQMAASVADEAGTGTAVTAAGPIPAGTVGPVCLSGMWPDLTFVPGTPFEVTDRP
ncbi:MAG: nucleoside hydrolase [Candidatus Limnocylindrales bacterium]